MLVLYVIAFICSLSFNYYITTYTGPRSLVKDRVPDLVHDVVPYHGDEYLVDILLALLTCCEIALSMYLKHTREANRVLWVYTCLYLQRASLMWLTTFQDPSPHCRVDDYTLSTCGDQIFSGHAFCVMICSFYFNAYCKNRTINAIIHTLVALCCILIITTRLHYTVDVVLSLYFSYYTWSSIPL